MDAAWMRKTFALIAKGLVEKEQLKKNEPARYPYSRALQHGINMFLAASHQAGGVQEVTQFANEAAFLARFASKPIAEWFEEWDSEAVKTLNLQEEPFYDCGAFAYQRSGNLYSPSSECYEYLDLQDSNIMQGTDERVLYEKMIVLEQEKYCRIRRSLIEHPILTIEEKRGLLSALADDPAASDAVGFAYEKVPEDCYRCPSCGWTMTRGKYGMLCHSPHCTDTIPDLTDAMKLETSDDGPFRLKKGIMRYFAAPGKLELAIAEFCKKKAIPCELWPQMDRYDAELYFPDGEVWAIDAKMYRNPLMLRAKIQQDNGFPEGDYAKGYFVIPDEYTVHQKNYTKIIDSALKDQKNVKCVTWRTLKKRINEKEAMCHES